MNMKRLHVGLVAASLAVLMSVAAMGQTSAQPSNSLGDYARSVRKTQGQKAPEAKHYDNDNLPQNEKISVVGQTPAVQTADNLNGDAPKTDATASTPGDPGKSADGDKKDADSSQDSKQAEYADWQGKIADQKKQIDLASRELDVLQREYQLRAAAMYADAGNRLRNAGAWDKEDTDYKQKIADKQKAVDTAKQKLDEMQEQARKAGVPSSMRE
jgi:hypothetical protein